MPKFELMAQGKADTSDQMLSIRPSALEVYEKPTATMEFFSLSHFLLKSIDLFT